MTRRLDITRPPFRGVRGWRRWLFAGVAVTFGVGLALLFAEVSVRLLGLPSEPRRHFDPGIYAPDAALGWALKPNYRGVCLEDNRSESTSTNALGFRGPDWDQARRRASFRVLMLGDSATFGLGVGDDETYPGYLEAILRRRGLDAAVFNAGVPGYSTVQEAEVLQRLASLQPHVVAVSWLSNDLLARPTVDVLDGYLVHDIERYLDWREAVDHRGGYRSALYRFVLVRSKLLKEALGMRRDHEPRPFNPEELNESTTALLRIKERTNSLPAKLVLVLLPRREQVEHAARNNSLYDRMTEFGRSHGIPVVNLAEIWRERATVEDRYLPRDSVHLTSEGYREVAEAVAGLPVFRNGSAFTSLPPNGSDGSAGPQ